MLLPFLPHWPRQMRREDNFEAGLGLDLFLIGRMHSLFLRQTHRSLF
jgi:hypothetical protein